MIPDLPCDPRIGGDPVPCRDRFAVHDPATSVVLAMVGDASPTEARQAVGAAHDGFGAWSAAAPRQRAEVLRRCFEILTAELETCARLIVMENGKAWQDAVGEAAYAAEFFRWFSEEACRVTGDFRTAPAGDKTIVVTHQPLGVAYLITPWNFPAAMATRKLAPALAAGCTAVLKPAEETPLTALWIADVLQRAGVPDGVVNVVTTTDPAGISTAVLADPRVATLSFTGSTEVGKQLLSQTARRVLPSSMELGGNAPLLVLEGADVSTAVEGAFVAKMRNGGSACTAANRLYVHESVVGDFVSGLARRLAAMRIGPGSDPSNDLGAMVSTRERDKILELVDRSRDEGGRVSSWGTPPTGGAFLAPTLVQDVDHGSTLTRREIFGPVAPVITFGDVDEAVAMANDSEHGLISYVFAGSAAEGLAVGRRLESGMVAVNRGVASDPAAPFGGMKESGLGREGGFAGIHEFLETQYLAADF